MKPWRFPVLAALFFAFLVIPLLSLSGSTMAAKPDAGGDGIIMIRVASRDAAPIPVNFEKPMHILQTIFAPAAGPIRTGPNSWAGPEPFRSSMGVQFGPPLVPFDYYIPGAAVSSMASFISHDEGGVGFGHSARPFPFTIA